MSTNSDAAIGPLESVDDPSRAPAPAALKAQILAANAKTAYALRNISSGIIAASLLEKESAYYVDPRQPANIPFRVPKLYLYFNDIDVRVFILTARPRGIEPLTSAFGGFLNKVLPMETHEIAERLGVPPRAFGWRFTAINPTLDVQHPFLRVPAAEKRLVDIFSFASNLSASGPRFELRERRHFVCALCALRSRKVAKSGVSRHRTECTRRGLCH